MGTALWSVYSVLGTVVGMGPTYRTPCWWGRPCGLCTVCTVYCGGNGAHIQDTVLVGTALWSVYSVYCVLWWEWGPHTGHHAGGDGLVVCVQCVRYCVLWWEWGPHTGHRAGGDGLVVCVQCVRYCVLWWEWGPHTGYRAGGDGLLTELHTSAFWVLVESVYRITVTEWIKAPFLVCGASWAFISILIGEPHQNIYSMLYVDPNLYAAWLFSVNSYLYAYW